MKSKLSRSLEKLKAEKSERSIGEVCRAHGIAPNTFYRWRHHYGGMQLPEVKRLKELEQENARLKRLLAERCLEIDVIKVIRMCWQKTAERAAQARGGLCHEPAGTLHAPQLRAVWHQPFQQQLPAFT